MQKKNQKTIQKMAPNLQELYGIWATCQLQIRKVQIAKLFPPISSMIIREKNDLLKDILRGFMDGDNVCGALLDLR